MDYKPKGVCSQQIHFDIIDNKVRNVSFVGGCFPHRRHPLWFQGNFMS